MFFKSAHFCYLKSCRFYKMCFSVFCLCKHVAWMVVGIVESLDCFGHLNNSNFQSSWTWDECLSVGIISSSFYPYMDFSFFKITTVFIIVKIANNLNACPSVSGWLNNPQPWNILAPIRKTWVSSAKSWRERGSRARIPQNRHYWVIYWPECGPRQQLGLDKRHIYRSVWKWFHPNWNVLGLTRSRGHPWYQCPIVKISLNSFVCLWFTRQLWHKKWSRAPQGAITVVMIQHSCGCVKPNP